MPCGTTVAGNASYCPASGGVYYHLEFLRALNDQYGDFAAVTVLAHEWGHHVQAQLGITREFTGSHELMADCFAGAYAWDAEALGHLDIGDIEEAQTVLANSGDAFGTAWFNPAAHGRPQERLLAFNTGYNYGSAACLEDY